ncbi:MAG: Crp/Fnr family transcriptional regulator [Tannerella sp.]|jgi:CRP-like cAMP-binding protein|nr:Crp/Fnr family transcriptional regulator [Tannerella sp.]
METSTEKIMKAARKLCLDYLASPTAAAVERLAAILVPMHVEKKGQLLRAGEVCDRLYYVERGMIRQYYYKNGRELTEHFACEEDVFINIESYFLGQPTHLMAEAIEPSDLYGIPRKEFRLLMAEMPEIGTLYHRMLEKVLIDLSRHLDGFRFETATERYQHFLKTSPEVIRRAPLADIASYLLMTPETLSRVRAGH